MKTSRVLPGAIVAGSLALSAMFAAAPAAAATLPAGQKITVIDAYDDQYYDVNPSTAVATPFGTPTTVGPEVSGVDVDDTGVGYAVGTYWYYEGEIDIELEEDEQLVEEDRQFLDFPGYPWYPDGGAIFNANANTGVLTDEKPVIIDLLGDEDPYASDCTAIDYSGGVIVAVCYLAYDGYTDGWIGTVDVSDPDFAVLTPIIATEWDGLLYITAIAKNPVTGVYWAFDSNYGELYSFTLESEGLDFQGDVDEHLVLGADFDRSGQLWLSVYELPDIVPLALNPSYLSLATFDFASVSVAVVDTIASEDPYEISDPQALTVWGALANTGSVASVSPAIAAAGVLLVGAILAAGAMVLRRREDPTV